MNATKTHSKWRRRLRWLAVLALLFVVFSVVSVEVTSRPRFCNSCHIMEPYYSSWEEDIHKDVSCVGCHIEPGAENYVAAKLNGLGQVVDDWLNRTSTKPSAAVSDLSCSRDGCHNLDRLQDLKTTTDKFMFRHGKHLGREYRGIEIHCSTCHSHVKGDKHFEVNTNVCITCHLTTNESGLIVKATDNGFDPVNGNHIADGAGAAPAALAEWTSDTVAPQICTKCHIAPDEPFEHEGVRIDHAEYLSYGAVCDACHHGVTSRPLRIDDGQCLTCHVFGVEEVEDTESVHRIHSEGEHKVECFNCHGVTRHGPVAQSMVLNELTCRDCHDDQHAVQRAAYLTQSPMTSDADVTSPVSPMFLVHVDCTGCHVQPNPVSSNPASGATVALAVPSACDACHPRGQGEQMVPMWQRDTKALYDLAMGLLPTAENPWDENCAEAAPLLEQAQHLLDLVRVDGSWGVHNPRYTEGLLEQARTSIQLARGRCEQASGGGP